MEFRIGVNLGDVMVEGEQIYGDGVNVAARLESLADPGGICISATVQEQVRDKLALGYEDLGAQTVKNIARPVHAYRVAPERRRARGVLRVPRKYVRRSVFSAVGLAIIAATFILVQHISLKPPTTSASISLEDKAPSLPNIPSIAVMPFTNMSDDRNQEYFTDGVTDDLTVALAKSPDLLVISPPSTFSYKGKGWNPTNVGRELGVQYLVTGGVRRADNQVRVTAHLVEASTGRELWVANYDRAASAKFALLDDLVQRISKTLNIRIQAEQGPGPALELGVMTPHGVVASSSEAYNYFLLGSQLQYSYTRDGIAKAREFEEKAIALDPNYGFAYVVLGSTYLSDVLQQWDQPGDLERASEAAQKAIEVADSNLCASCGNTLASLVAFFKQQHDQAITYAERAVEFDPNLSVAYYSLALALLAVGRIDEALDAVQKAMRLDPRNRDFYLPAVAAAYLMQGRYSDSINVLKRYSRRSPNEITPHASLVIAYIELGEKQAAAAEAAEVLHINPNWKIARWTVYIEDKALNERWAADLKQVGLS
jgi:adenylate cyclase